MPETSFLAILCESKLKMQMNGRSRLTASSIAGLSLRRRSRLNQTTLTATFSTYAIYLLISVNLFYAV